MRWSNGKDLWSAVRRHKWLAMVAVFTGMVLLTIAWSVSASVRGQMVARFDVARGYYEVQGYGLPVPWREEYAQLLEHRYGVRFRTVALCIVSESLVAYVDSYNDVSMRAVNRMFGRDVFKECADEARRNWAKTHAMLSE
jgi:hypothetical protein